MNAFARSSRFTKLMQSTPTVQIAEQTLTLNGVSVHRRFIFSVYQLALYLKLPTQKSEEILESKNVIYAQMKFLRNLSAKEVSEGFFETFTKNCADHCQQLRFNMETLIKFIPDVKEDDAFDFTFLPNKTVIGNAKGNLEFPGVEFGRVFLRAWVGEHPPSSRFRKELLGSE